MVDETEARRVQTVARIAELEFEQVVKSIRHPIDPAAANYRWWVLAVNQRRRR